LRAASFFELRETAVGEARAGGEEKRTVGLVAESTHRKNPPMMDEEHRKNIEKIMVQMDCPKGFACHQSGFESLCRADERGNLGLDHFVCLEGTPPPCPLSIPFGDGYFCKCPLRVYVCKYLNR